MRLVDVVNFNADASCLPAQTWLDALRGGERSRLYRWLSGYVEHGRKVTLGLVGSTLVDVATFNPEVIALVNANPQVFESILRPFAHDIGLLRSRAGFVLNLELGRAVVTGELAHVTPYLLAPEFMLTSEQVAVLAERDVAGTFINPGRFPESIARRIPRHPYRLLGLFGAVLDCLPVAPDLTVAYLAALHAWSAAPWNAAVARHAETACAWRDGESWLFVPDGVAREHAWLAGESAEVERVFVRELVQDAKFESPTLCDPDAFETYPVHSFSDWVGESRMFGFLQRLRALEERLHRLSPDERVCWLQAANSDVLSAVEKAPPRIRIRTRPPADADAREIDWEIRRSQRGYEGEEFLCLAEQLSTSEAARRYVADSDRPHIRKLRARIDYFGAARRAAALEIA